MTEPYAHGPGSVPVSTSEDREKYLVSSGIAATRREWVLAYVAEQGERGTTGRELREDPNVPDDIREYANGTSTLTGLYILGDLVRLKERRNQGYVYICPDFVNGRDTIPYRPASQRRYSEGELRVVEALIQEYESRDTLGPNQKALLSFLKKSVR